MAVEVIVHVEDRKVPLDIEPADLKGLKKEFEEWCAEDEAMTSRRQVYAPVFSMIAASNMKMEIKRKHIFRGGEDIYVSWSSLQLENESENQAAMSLQHGHEASLSVKETIDSGSRNTAAEVLDNIASTSGTPENDKVLTARSPTHSVSSLITDDSELSKTSDFESEDDEDYGEVKEYFTDAEWAKIPKYLKFKEKSRFEIHENQNKKRAEMGDPQKPFEPDVMLKSSKVQSYSSRNRKRTSESIDIGEGSRKSQRLNLHQNKPSQSGSSLVKGMCNTEKLIRPKANEKQMSNAVQKSTDRPLRVIQTNSQSGPSSEGGGFIQHDQLLELKPHLPQYNIPEILEETYKDGNEQLKEHIDELKSKGIVFNKTRVFIVRLLTRHLYYKIAENPREVSSDMREGLAKSIVLHYPKFQIQADCKTSYPWDHFYSRGVGRGWIANSARSIQKKFRTRKSKQKPKKSAIVSDPDDPDKLHEDETIQALGLMMPGRGEKSEIIRGMKATFKFRQDARKNLMPVSQMLQKFPHLASYDGEILQIEFNLIHPSAHDLCKNFQKYLPGILALESPSCSKREIPIEDDTLKALLLLAQTLPKDIRVKGDPKSISPKADLKQITEVVQLGQDIDTFVCDKIEASSSSIQPYLILVRSPLHNKITRFFLVLDDKPMQIASGSIVKALDMLVKSFFVFNVKYPLGWRATFHFLAACFANAFEKGLTRPDAITPSEQELLKKISQS